MEILSVVIALSTIIRFKRYEIPTKKHRNIAVLWLVLALFATVSTFIFNNNMLLGIVWLTIAVIFLIIIIIYSKMIDEIRKNQEKQLKRLESLISLWSNAQQNHPDDENAHIYEYLINEFEKDKKEIEEMIKNEND